MDNPDGALGVQRVPLRLRLAAWLLRGRVLPLDPERAYVMAFPRLPYEAVAAIGENLRAALGERTPRILILAGGSIFEAVAERTIGEMLAAAQAAREGR